MLLKAVIIILIGALIGWITNYLAIKMLFRPYKEINIFGFKIQGLIPKRKKEIAVNIAETIDRELLSIKDVTSTLDSLDISDEIDLIVDDIVDKKIKVEILEKFPMAALFLNESMINKIKVHVKNSIDENKEHFFEVMVEKLEDKIDFKEIIKEKIEDFSLEEMERIVTDIAKKELKHIEIVGAILGALIGCVQVLIGQFL